jgi:hypothetical protein
VSGNELSQDKEVDTNYLWKKKCEVKVERHALIGWQHQKA